MSDNNNAGRERCNRCGSSLIIQRWTGENYRERHDAGEPPDKIECEDCGYVDTSIAEK